MKKLLLIGLGCLAFTGAGVLTEAQAGVQVSINLGGYHRPYYRPAPVYYPAPGYYYDCPPAVVYRRPVVVYSRPPVYHAPRAVVYGHPYVCR